MLEAWREVCNDYRGALVKSQLFKDIMQDLNIYLQNGRVRRNLAEDLAGSFHEESEVLLRELRVSGQIPAQRRLESCRKDEHVSKLSNTC